MDILEKLISIVESGIQFSGVDPILARSEAEGQWNLMNGDLEVWIDLWNAEDQGKIYFQVMCPLVYIPKENEQEFLRELLDINYQTIEAYLVTFKEGVYVKVIREADFLSAEEVSISITRVGYYGDMFLKAFTEKYKAQKLILQQNPEEQDNQ